MDVKIDGKKCERCEYEWKPQTGNENPIRCPKCGSPYWNRPKTKKEEQEINNN